MLSDVASDRGNLEKSYQHWCVCVGVDQRVLSALLWRGRDKVAKRRALIDSLVYFAKV